MNDAEPTTAAPADRTCPQCHAVLPPGVLDGLCPACLLQQGASPDSETQPKTAPFAPPAEAEITRLFPQLEVIELIGKGGMGAVYKARQPALDRLVALKVLPAQTADGAAFAERFNREARALAKLNHPSIVGVYEFGQVEALHYFIMEYVDGANLRQLERNGRLGPRQALQILPEICDALQYAHDEGVVHRDIKPENVLVDRKGRVKIADFGLAKILGCDPQELRLTGEGQVMGTPHYMSPEQVERPLEVDHRADIYSLGVVFYEMLTGELPLGRFAPPSRKVRVDVRLDEVVLHALEKDPERRYQHASQVKTDVETIAHSGVPAGANPQPASAQTHNPRPLPSVLEISAHMTDAERWEGTKRGLLFGVWNAATFFTPFFLIMAVPAPAGWILGAGAFLIGLAFYPLWRRMMREQLCATAWARQQGLTPDQLKGLVGKQWLPLVAVRNGRRIIHWPGVLITSMLVLVLAEAGSLLACMALMGSVDGRAMAVAAASSMVFMVGLIRLGFTTPIERLTTLPDPRSPAAKTVIIIFAGIMAALVLAAGVLLVALVGWGLDSETIRTPLPAPSVRMQPPSRNAVSVVRCEGSKAIIEYEVDDAHEIVLFVGSEALGWSSWHADTHTGSATVEASDQIKMADGSRGRGFIFQSEGASHYVAITPDGPVPFGELVFRSDGKITQKAGTFTFADIHQADFTRVAVSVRVRPVMSFGSETEPTGTPPMPRVPLGMGGSAMDGQTLPAGLAGDGRSVDGALELKLHQAKEELARVKALHASGRVTQAKMMEAQLARDVAAAELAGEVAAKKLAYEAKAGKYAGEVATLKLKFAPDELRRVERRSRAGRATVEDVQKAKLAKELAEEESVKMTSHGKGK